MILRLFFGIFANSSGLVFILDKTIGNIKSPKGKVDGKGSLGSIVIMI